MRNIKLYESFSNEREIKDLCSKYKITNYQIRDDVSIDVDENVNLYGKLGECSHILDTLLRMSYGWKP
jgi:hypothetical protein